MIASSNPFVSQIQERLEPASNPQDAEAMAAYMKNQFPFLGIKKESRNQLTKGIVQEFVKSNPQAVLPTAKELWQLDEREYQYVALELLIRYKKQLKEEELDDLEYLIIEKSWWDSVDHLATHLCGSYFAKYPQAINERIHFWSESGNTWLIRSAILFQLKYKEQTNVKLLQSLIERHASNKEFFIAKAIGWALREYAKTNPAAVSSLVKAQPMQNLSKREALKHLLST
jgi:3-methyladenine DNA glycosylase AlkD